jgi:excisionase family DNA binding protein
MNVNMNENRVDASLLTKEEREVLQPLLDLAQRNQHPSLKGADGTEIRLPVPIFQMLVKVIEDMRNGRAIVLLPEDETFTTQAAANFLGMSRQHFVTLLETGEIPFHRVGSHRRVTFKDLRDYAGKRDAGRRARLGSLFKKVKDAGLYDADYTGESAENAG